MIRRLILWDIDGTLARCGTVATDIFHIATERVVGRRPASSIRFSGKTDRQITEEFLALVGSTDTNHAERILDHIESELAARAHEIATNGAVCPGAKAAIEALAAIDGVTQSVLTGNIAPNARVKLTAFGLDTLLDLDAGAYGREHTDRRLLLGVAWQQQLDRYGRRFTPDETWIVGDTPRDLECATASGAHCLLVGTGRYSTEELSGLGADAVLGDLTDTDTVVSVLTGPAGLAGPTGSGLTRFTGAGTPATEGSAAGS